MSTTLLYGGCVVLKLYVYLFLHYLKLLYYTYYDILWVLVVFAVNVMVYQPVETDFVLPGNVQKYCFNKFPDWTRCKGECGNSWVSLRTCRNEQSHRTSPRYNPATPQTRPNSTQPQYIYTMLIYLFITQSVPINLQTNQFIKLFKLYFFFF